MSVINNLIPIFGSKAKSQEILYLLAGLKLVVRHGFYEHELGNVTEFCAKNNIASVKSQFKVVIADHDELFSNKGLKVESAEAGMYFLYFSLNENLANLAAKFELNDEHKKLGMILGYPNCCINHFVTNFSEIKVDLAHDSDNPYTNLGKRADDFVILSHFPCKPNCKESIILAEKYYDLLLKIDPVHAKSLWMTLTNHVL